MKEKSTGSIQFGASLAPAIGLAGFVGYEQPNLFGRAKQGRFRWLFGARTNDVEVGYNDPSVLGSRNSFGISLRSARCLVLPFRIFQSPERASVWSTSPRQTT